MKNKNHYRRILPTKQGKRFDKNAAPNLLLQHPQRNGMRVHQRSNLASDWQKGRLCPRTILGKLSVNLNIQNCGDKSTKAGEKQCTRLFLAVALAPLITVSVVYVVQLSDTSMCYSIVTSTGNRFRKQGYRYFRYHNMQNQSKLSAGISVSALINILFSSSPRLPWPT